MYVTNYNVSNIIIIIIWNIPYDPCDMGYMSPKHRIQIDGLTDINPGRTHSINHDSWTKKAIMI